MNKTSNLFRCLIFALTVLSTFTSKVDNSFSHPHALTVEAFSPIKNLALGANKIVPNFNTGYHKTIQISAPSKPDLDKVSSSELIVIWNSLRNEYQEKNPTIIISKPQLPALSRHYINLRGPPLDHFS